MIIQCESCSRKFIVKDSDIPEGGRTVQCGHCSVTWHQKSISVPNKPIKLTKIVKPSKKINESLSVEAIKASDGKTYKFLGSQWAQLLPSGKTGLFAKKKIGRELDKITGRKREESQTKKRKKIKKELDPSSGNLENQTQTAHVYQKKHGMGFFGYFFLLIIVAFSMVGILKTFESDLINYIPEMEHLFELLNEQLKYLAETVKNIIVIIQDLRNSY